MELLELGFQEPCEESLGLSSLVLSCLCDSGYPCFVSVPCEEDGTPHAMQDLGEPVRRVDLHTLGGVHPGEEVDNTEEAVVALW